MITKNRRFTLIELLVLIGILMTLIALLLPALKTAKDTAKSAVCASNLKQMGMACSTYRSDYNQYLPVMFPKFSDTYFLRSYIALLAPYAGFRRYSDSSGHIVSSPDLNLVKTRKYNIFYCPAEGLPNARNDYSHEFSSKGPSWDQMYSTYHMNKSLGWSWDSTTAWNKPKHYLQYPSEALFYVDGDGGTLNANWRIDYSYYQFLEPRHPGNSCNMLMGDMRVDNQLYTKIEVRLQTDKKFHLYVHESLGYQYAR